MAQNQNYWIDAWIEKAAKMAAEKVGTSRQDASYTSMFARELEHLMTRSFDVKYPELRAKLLIPVNNSVPTGADSVVYSQYDQFGEASVGGNYSDDINLVNTNGRQFTQPIVPIKDAYEISIQDLRASAMTGKDLPTRMISTCRRVIEQKIDDIVATGAADFGIATGLLNDAAIPTVAEVTGAWASATPEQIIGDVLKLWGSIGTLTNNVHLPNTLVLPTSLWYTLSARCTSSDLSVIKWLEQNLDGLTLITQWYKLNTADAGGAERMMAYQRSPETAEIIMSQEFEQFEPQWENLAMKVPCHARTAGINIYYPKAFAYMDDI